MELSRKRREEFKLSWGVSPRSINRKRTVKTMIVCSDKVNMSQDADKEGEAIQRIVKDLESTELELGRAQDRPQQRRDEDPFLSVQGGSPSAFDDFCQDDENAAVAPSELSIMASLESRNIDWFGDVFGADAAMDLGKVEEEEEVQIEQDDNASYEPSDEDTEETEMEITQVRMGQ